jgi:hypothetical protein
MSIQWDNVPYFIALVAVVGAMVWAVGGMG